MDGRNRIAHMKKVKLQLLTYFELRKGGEILYLESIAATLLLLVLIILGSVTLTMSNTLLSMSQHVIVNP